MKKFMTWMENSFAPRMNKIARNPWMVSVQEAILTCMPVILIGSLVSVLAILNNYIEGFPNVQPISDFSMGLLSVFLSFLIPYNLMEKKKHRKIKREAGIAGLFLFLMLCAPIFDADGNITFVFWNLGSGGMLTALVAGLFAGFVMHLFAKFSFFKEDTVIPDFITVWFDTLIPMSIIILIGWLLTYIFKFNMFDAINWLFSPVLAVGDSFIGVFVIYFIGYAFLYTFGISTWLLYSLEVAITFPALAVNQAAVEAGHEATKIVVQGFSTYLTIGGAGCTLALGLMFLFMAKSKKNRLIGKTTLIPSICNINEPIVFGAPIAFNPILMVPMWIVGFIVPLITYLAMYFNIVPKISMLWAFGYMPFPITAYIRGGIPGVVLIMINFAISWVIYYPFFKIYDKQCVKEEEEKMAELNLGN